MTIPLGFCWTQQERTWDEQQTNETDPVSIFEYLSVLVVVAVLEPNNPSASSNTNIASCD